MSGVAIGCRGSAKLMSVYCTRKIMPNQPTAHGRANQRHRSTLIGILDVVGSYRLQGFESRGSAFGWRVCTEARGGFESETRACVGFVGFVWCSVSRQRHGGLSAGKGGDTGSTKHPTLRNRNHSCHSTIVCEPPTQRVRRDFWGMRTPKTVWTPLSPRQRYRLP